MAAKARQQYYADGEYIDKQAREFQPTMEFKTKIDSIEPGAQVNIIEDIKVNGTSLEVDDKTVDISIPLVIDNLYSTDGVNALSAKQGKVLYDLVQNLASRGRYLSNWNTATGLPTTNPVESHYQYRAGDYYVVSNVAAQGGTNYRPEPGEFVIGQASVTVETEVVKVTDMYLYDGSNWNLLINSTREIAIDSSLSTSSTNPVENRVVTNAINGKQDTLVAGSNIQIASDGKTISATDTTYTAGTNVSIDANNEISAVDTTYTAGANVQISNSNVISATDTTYAAGDNIAITNNTISATYTAGTGIDITNGVISNTQTSAEWGNITGTLSDQTDLQSVLDDKQDELTAGTNIQISNNVISATDTTYTAGTGIDIINNEISADTTVLATKTDLSGYATTTALTNGLATKQDTLIAGDGIDIDANDEISVDVTDIIGTGLSEDNNNNIIVDTTVVATKTDLSGKQDKATSGSTAPSTTPSYVGQQYIDTTNDKMYVATGTSSSSDWTEVGAGSGDMLYSDFNWVTKTGATITLDLRSEITPSTDFTVNKPSTLEDGQYYILRVTSGATAYTMTLGANVTNPYSEDLTLEASTIQQFTFLAKGGNLELQPSSEGAVYTAGDGIDIDANNEISVDVTDIIGTGLSEDDNNNIIVDSTVVAMQSDLANYYTKTQTYSKTEVDNLISSFGSFEVVDTLPSVSTASEKTIYLLGPIGTGADKYEEWIVSQTPNVIEFEHDEENHSYSPSTLVLSHPTTLTINEYVGEDYASFQIYKFNQAETEYDYDVEFWTSGWRDCISGTCIFVDANSITVPAGTYQLGWGGAAAFTSISFTTSDINKSWTKIGETSVDLSDLNTKTFYLSSNSDLTTAQAAYDWYRDGKTPIILFGGYSERAYFPVPAQSTSTQLVFEGDKLEINIDSSKSLVSKFSITFALSSGTVTGISLGMATPGYYLDTNQNYSTPYTPQYNGSPTTKKYVDDRDVYIGTSEPTSNKVEGRLWYDTTNDILKVYDGTNWNEVGGGIISSNNTYEDIVHLSQAEYDALTTKDPNTLYSTPEGDAEGFVDNTAFGSSWDGVTNKAPSMNAVYDVLGNVETLLANI